MERCSIPPFFFCYIYKKNFLFESTEFDRSYRKQSIECAIKNKNKLFFFRFCRNSKALLSVLNNSSVTYITIRIVVLSKPFFFLKIIEIVTLSVI